MNAPKLFFYGSYAMFPILMGTTLLYPLPVLVQMCLYASCVISIGSHLSLLLITLRLFSLKRMLTRVPNGSACPVASGCGLRGR